jgi:site-specific DNA-methyltransferase (adenine-specific)
MSKEPQRAESWRNRIVGEDTCDPSQLLANPYNWRIHPHEQELALRGILDEVGWVQRVIVNKRTGHVVDGHLRVATAISKGETAVPVLYVDLTEDEEKKVLLTIDPVGAMAVMDADKFKELLAEVEFASEDARKSIDAAAEDAGVELGEPETEADAEPQIDRAAELNKKWQVKAGDLWRIGEHRLLCGDSTKREDVERVMGGEKAGSVVCDPPFGMAFVSNHRNVKHNPIAGDDDATLLVLACGLDVEHSRYVFCRWDNIYHVPKPKSLITWAKNNWSMGDLEHEHARQTECILFYPCKSHSWPINRPTDLVNHARTQNELHPTEKPVSLLAEVVGWTGGVILDPFLGSGPTMVACENLKRKCRGIEISPDYCAVILERMATAFPQLKAERIK